MPRCSYYTYFLQRELTHFDLRVSVQKCPDIPIVHIAYREIYTLRFKVNGTF